MTYRLDRRTLLIAGAAATLAGPAARAAGERKALALDLAPREVVLQPGQKPVTAWRFVPDTPPRFAQGDTVDVTITNRLPAPVHVFFRGLDGAAALEPILARGPIPSGATQSFSLPLPHAGTLICDARLGGGETPLPMLPIVVAERTPATTDRDEVLLIEDWRPQPDGPASYTLNGAATWALAAAPGERLRLRFVNGAQRAILAVQLSGLDVRVIAIDGQPSEVFPARDSRLVLAPGTRIDAVVDMPAGGPFAVEINTGERTVKIGEITAGGPAKAARGELNALSSNGLPERLGLQSALRVNVPLDPASNGAVDGKQPSLYRVKRGRTVVMALANTLESNVIFHLHGHHMRLLDRLDDGWKPFWLNTLAVPAKQTVRVAFAATHPGTFLIETATTAWGSPKKLQSYVVEP